MLELGLCSSDLICTRRSISCILVNYSSSFSALVAVRKPTKLILRQTWENNELQASGELKIVSIMCMHLSPSGEAIVLADINNASVKAINLSTGSLTILYKENTPSWDVGAALLIGGGEEQRLVLVEWKKDSDKQTEKRLVVAAKRDATDIFRLEYDIKWTVDPSVLFTFLELIACIIS